MRLLIAQEMSTGWIDLFIVGYVTMLGGIYCFWAGVKRRETVIISWICAAVLIIISCTLLCLGTNILTSPDRRSENVSILTIVVTELKLGDIERRDIRPMINSVVAGGTAEQPVESWSTQGYALHKVTV